MLSLAGIPPLPGFVAKFLIFRNVMGAGHTTYADLKHSIMDVLLSLPPETVVYPGHGMDTTIAEERMSNPFLNGTARIASNSPGRAAVSPCMPSRR